LPGFTVTLAVPCPQDDPLAPDASTAYVAYTAFDGTVFVMDTGADAPAASATVDCDSVDVQPGG
jgi:hypothetical protein